MQFKLLILLVVLFLSDGIMSKEKLSPNTNQPLPKVQQLITEKNTMTDKTNKEICIDYLEKYANKDLASIEKMFSEDIILRDWKIRVIGIKEAIRETRKNFESAKTIEIEVLSTYENENTVAAELKITVDSAEILYVIDVITINSSRKIEAIRAYLGRGDE